MTEQTELDKAIEELELDYVEIWTTDENGNPTKVKVY